MLHFDSQNLAYFCENYCMDAWKRHQENKRGSMLPQLSAPMDLTSATEALKQHQRSIAEERYLSDPHARVHKAFTGSQHCYQHWQWDWSRDQCVMMAQVRTGHSPLVAAYLRCIRWRDSAICPHCQNAEETVDHLVFQCLAHDQARRDTWPGLFYNRPVTPLELPGTDWGGDPPPNWEWERERERERINITDGHDASDTAW